MVVNLYPFSATAAKPGVTPEELIENIDIGGPAMVRSAAKNFQSVGVVTDPDGLSGDRQRSCASKRELEPRDAARHWREKRMRARRATTARSRRNSNAWRANGNASTHRPLEKLPQRMHIALERRQAMRYGENPHQAAALYIPAGQPAAGLAGAKQLQGKELSYNNLVDLDAAWSAGEGISSGRRWRSSSTTIRAARRSRNRCAMRILKALACDPVSAFGGVLAFNRPLDAATAEEVAKLFVECIVAPGYEPARAREIRGEEESAAAGDAARAGCAERAVN